jgi:hypothetical protein
MKNYKDSDYASNKFSDGIVYRFAEGIVEITLKDYLAENPDKTVEDFMELPGSLPQYPWIRNGYIKVIVETPWKRQSSLWTVEI